MEFSDALLVRHLKLINGKGERVDKVTPSLKLFHGRSVARPRFPLVATRTHLISYSPEGQSLWNVN